MSSKISLEGLRTRFLEPKKALAKIVTRRSFLKGSAAMAVAADAYLSSSRYSLDHGTGWLALHQAGIERFRIQTSKFHGNPKIWFSEEKNRIAFGLNGARFPGTDLSADLLCEMWPGAFGTNVSLAIESLGLAFRGYAHDWLDGQGLVARNYPGKMISLSHELAITLHHAQATFNGQGTLSFRGDRCADVRLRGRTFVADRLTMDLARPVQALIRNAAARRTAITATRGQNDWPLEPPAGDWTYWSTDTRSCFDTIEIEAHESYSKKRSHVVVATRDDNRPPVQVKLANPLIGTSRRESRFLIDQPVYAQSLGALRDARFSAHLSRPSSLRLANLSLKFRNPVSRPAIEVLDNSCGYTASFVVDATAEGTLHEAIIAPVHTTDSWPLEISSSGIHDQGVAQPSEQRPTITTGEALPIVSDQFKFRMLRPSDFVDLLFDFRNIDLRVVNQTTIVFGKKDKKKDSLMIVTLGAQTLVEQTTPTSDPPDDDGCVGVTFPQKAALAGPSRISFKLFTKSDEDQFLNFETLLGWQDYPLQVCQNAVSGNSSTPTGAPTELDTSVDMPGGIIFSPDETGSFFTSTAHVDQDDTFSIHNGDTYRLWNARLQPNPKSTIQVRPVQAIPTKAPFSPTGLDDAARSSIVNELSGKYLPVSRFAVSTHGGWIKGGTRLTPSTTCSATASLDGVNLDIAAGLEILEQISYPAYLIPTGHYVSLVETTMRQWCRDGKQLLEGALLTRYKIVFREATRDFTSYLQPSKGLSFPFSQITIPIKETPTLSAPEAIQFLKDYTHCSDCNPSIPGNCPPPYWAPFLDNGVERRFQFPVICTDRDGIDHPSTMEMMLAVGTKVTDHVHFTGYLQSLAAAYAGDNVIDPANPNISSNTSAPNFGGKSVSYAKSNRPGDAAFPTNKTILQVQPVVASDLAAVQAQIPWYPTLLAADLALDTTSRFTQSGAGSQLFKYSSYYQSGPFDNPLGVGISNPPEIILDVYTLKTQALSFYGKLAGGLIRPATNVIALTRRFGNAFTTAASGISDADASLQSLATNIFNVAEAFGEVAQLLGAFGLSDVLDNVANAVENAAAVPKLLSQQLNDYASAAASDLDTLANQIQALVTAFEAFDPGNAADTIFDNLLSSLMAKIAPQLVYMRIFACEQISAVNTQLAENVTALETIVNPSAVSALQTILNQSLDYRLQTTAAPIGFSKDTIPTLFQLRDYILSMALSKSDNLGPAWAALSAFPPPDYASSVTAPLDKLRGDLQKFVKQITAPYSAIKQNLDVISQSLNGTANPLQIVSVLQQTVSLLASLSNPTASADTTSLTADVAACTSAVSNAISQFASVLNVVQQDTTLAPYVSQVQSILTNAITQSYFSTQAVQSALTNLTTLPEWVAIGSAYKAAMSVSQTAISTINNFLTTVLSIPKQLQVSYDYDTPLKTFGMFLASKDGNNADLALHTSITLNLPGLDGGQLSSDVSISTQVNNFTLLLIPDTPFLSVGFKQASFASNNGASPTVNVQLDQKDIQFYGPLNFVTQLADSIHLPGGLTVQQLAAGVAIGFNIALPDITSGAFTLTNVSLSSGVTLDFLGGPFLINFGFAEPNQHFVMAYTIFGGGGYLDFAFAPLSGTFDINGALEFGAIADLDFGVAEGDLYVFGGFLFNITGDELDLGGYLRAGGDLDVLDLITVSVEFSMSLSYEDRGGVAWLVGECDLSVEVDVLFFSESVDIRMHREFSGSQAA